MHLDVYQVHEADMPLIMVPQMTSINFHTKLFKLVLLERIVLHQLKSRVTFIDVKHRNQN